MSAQKNKIQIDWLDYWFKVPVVKCGNNDLKAALDRLKAQGMFTHTMIVKQGGYELHSRKD